MHHAKQDDNRLIASDVELRDFLLTLTSEAEETDMTIRRTFISYAGPNRSRAFARYINRAAAKGEADRYVATALIVYPALKWILKAKNLDDMEEHIQTLQQNNVDKNGKNLRNPIQDALSLRLSNEKMNLRLSSRKAFFARCEQLVDAIDRAADMGVFHGTRKNQAGRLTLAAAMLRGTELESDPISTRLIRTYTEDIVEDVKNAGAEEIVPLMQALSPGDGTLSDAEELYLYHNVSMLLREYSRIASPSQYDSNEVIRLLANEYAISGSSEAKKAQAQILIQYTYLIREAIRLMEEYPGDPDLYRVLVLVTNEKFGTKGTDEAMLAQRLGMNGSTFSCKKYKAFTALSALLWGCDVESLLSLLQ